MHYNGHTDNPGTPWPHGWDCALQFLQYLCEDCHEYVHGRLDYDPSDKSLAALSKRIDKFFGRYST